MTSKYMLDQNKKVVRVKELLEWADWFENADRKIKQEWIGDKWVSTVFLGLDFNYNEPEIPSEDYQPIVFETMIKHKEEGWLDYQERYSTYEEALAGHKRAVEWVKNGCKEDEL
jgi:hypothetical protein